MTSFSKPKIKRIKIDYYNKDYRYTTIYRNTTYIPSNDYYGKNILKCEIKFRYKFRIYTHILTGEITIIDIYEEILSILKREFIK